MTVASTDLAERDHAVDDDRAEGDRLEVVRRDEDPAQFLWHGRLYVVRAVLVRWTEVGRRWRTWPVSTVGDLLSPRGRSGAAGRPVPGDDAERGDAERGDMDCADVERDCWRVEAAAGRSGGVGVFDLCLDRAAGSWSLHDPGPRRR